MDQNSTQDIRNDWWDGIILPNGQLIQPFIEPPSQNLQHGDPLSAAEHTEQTAENLTHPNLRRWEPKEGSLLWVQETRRDQMLEEIEAGLRGVSGGKENGSTTETSKSRESNLSDYLAELDTIVARNPEGFMAWLETQALIYYRPSAKSMTWDEWSTMVAPIIYEAKYQPEASRRMLDNGFRTLAYRPVAPLRRVTFEEAVHGYQMCRAKQIHTPGAPIMPDIFPIKTVNPTEDRLVFQ